MPGKAHSIRRVIAAASLAAIFCCITMKSGTIRPRKIAYCFLFRRRQEGKKERGSTAVPGTTGRPAEVLPEGSGIKVNETDETAGDGAHNEHIYIKDAGNLPWQKASRARFIIDGR